MRPANDDSPTPRRFRFGLRTLFVLVAVVAAAIAYVKSIDWEYVHVVSLDCGEGRTIDIYVNRFCEISDFALYEVHANGAVAARKTGTHLDFDCGVRLDPKQFRLISDDSQSLFAVIYGPNEIVAVFDFKTGIGIPAIGADDNTIPADILDRLQFGTKN